MMCSTINRESNISRVWEIIKKFNNWKYVSNTYNMFSSADIARKII